MSTTSTNLMPLARLAATLIGAFGIIMGRLAVSYPEQHASMFGFHPRSSVVRSAASNPFIAISGGRNSAAGFAIVLCVTVVGSDRATGVLLMSAFLTGFWDAFALFRYLNLGVGARDGNGNGDGDGDAAQVEAEKRTARSAALGHLVTTGVIAGLGKWMVGNAER